MSKTTALTQVSLNIDETKEFLSHIVDNNRHLQAEGKPSVAVEIIGESGIGKTSSVLQLAKELKLNVVKLNLAQIEELGDLVGFPVRQFQLCKPGATTTPKTVDMIKQPKQVQRQVKNTEGKMEMKEVTIMVDIPNPDAKVEDTDGECLWIDEQACQEYTHQGYHFTGKKRMSYCPPEWIADKANGGFLILDDWNRADIRFIQAVMELN